MKLFIVEYTSNSTVVLNSGADLLSPEMVVPANPSQLVEGYLRPVPGAISSPFGMRYHPILKVNKMHTGIDLRARAGDAIRAAAAGTVSLARNYGAYGNAVIINHGNGISTLYGHSSLLEVRQGQQVQQGQEIAKVGSTGFSTGPHLHFEIRQNNKPFKPPFE